MKKISSIIALLITGGVIGAAMQYYLGVLSVQKDYVQIAANILINPKVSVDDELRLWASKVFNKYAPIPLNESLTEKLVDGKIYTPIIPKAPDILLNFEYRSKPIPYIRKNDGKIFSNLPESVVRSKDFDKYYTLPSAESILNIMIYNNEQAGLCAITLQGWKDWYSLNLETESRLRGNIKK